MSLMDTLFRRALEKELSSEKMTFHDASKPEGSRDRVDAKGSADGRTVGGKPRSRFGNRKSANLTRVTIPPRDFHEESVKIDGLATKCISWAFQV